MSAAAFAAACVCGDGIALIATANAADGGGGGATEREFVSVFFSAFGAILRLRLRLGLTEASVAGLAGAEGTVGLKLTAADVGCI